MYECDAPDRAEVKKLPAYIQRKNCTESEVNALMQVGYSLGMVTPLATNVVNKGRSIFSSELIYHFILRKVKS